MPVFVDTNVLVSSRDTADAAKHATATTYLQHEADFDGVRALDPFRSSVDDVL